MSYLVDLRLPLPADDFDRKLFADVKQYGWHILGIDPDPGMQAPPFSFSIGLYYSLGHPEIAITGLPHKRSQQIINVVGEIVRAEGPFEPDRRYSNVLQGHDVIMRKVPHEAYQQHFGTGVWFYRYLSDYFPAFQLYWPDRNGLFPWENGFEPSLLPLQFQIAAA